MRRELKREPQPIVRVTTPVDQLQVSVIQEEDPIQNLPRRNPTEATKRGRLGIRQELDRPRAPYPQPCPAQQTVTPLPALFVPLFPTGRVLRILGKGERVRHVPIHPQLRTALTGWLDERNDWPGAKTSPALFLNQRGQRLSVRGAHDIVTAIAAAAGLDDHATVHVLRHTFATTLVRGGTDLVIVAELLGHARLETTRGYTRPSAEDRTRALDLLLVDK